MHALLDLHLRWMGAHLRRDGPLESPEQTRRYLTARLRPHPFEVFACLLLDNRHRIIAFEALFRGTVDGASVHPRVVARRALAHNAAALIACHNHPNVAPPGASQSPLSERGGSGLCSATWSGRRETFGGLEPRRVAALLATLSRHPFGFMARAARSFAGQYTRVFH